LVEKDDRWVHSAGNAIVRAPVGVLRADAAVARNGRR